MIGVIVGIKVIGALSAVLLRRRDMVAVQVVAIYLMCYGFSWISGDSPADSGWFLRCAARDGLCVMALLWLSEASPLRSAIIGLALFCAVFDIIAYTDFVLEKYYLESAYPLIIEGVALLEIAALLNVVSFYRDGRDYVDRRTPKTNFRRGFT